MLDGELVRLPIVPPIHIPALRLPAFFKSAGECANQRFILILKPTARIALQDLLHHCRRHLRAVEIGLARRCSLGRHLSQLLIYQTDQKWRRGLLLHLPVPGSKQRYAVLQLRLGGFSLGGGATNLGEKKKGKRGDPPLFPPPASPGSSFFKREEGVFFFKGKKK